MLSSFNGVVEHLMFNNTYLELTKDYVRCFRKEKEVLYNVKFTNPNILGDALLHWGT